MRATFFYNWPPGKESVRFSLGVGNIEDPKYEFQILFSEKGSDVTKHFGTQEWLSYDTAKEIEHDFKKGARVHIKRRLIENQNVIEDRLLVDTEKEWPAAAMGATSVNTFYDF